VGCAVATFTGKVVWITGGGTGIGLSLAKAFAAQGAKVAVSGRREDRLSGAVDAIRAAGGEGLAVACDVTDEASVAAAVARVVATWGGLDVAVANAGFAVSGRIENLTDADWRRQFDTNVFGLVHTVRHAMPELRKTQGRMVLVGSVAGFVSARKNGAYNASKAAVRSIADTLAAELAGQGVSCTGIYPGFIESEIGQVSNDGVHDPARPDRRPAQLLVPTDVAAADMMRAITRRQREAVITGHGKLIVALSRLFPSLVALLARRT
jgi:NAD(P)-dependent dehydrogenase (short-subunit alcohol dehydrogenase family)